MKLLAVNERLELAAEFLDPRDDRDGARITQDADRLAGHVFGDLEQRVEIFHRSLSVTNALHDLRRPGSALAALGALAAALVGEETGEPRDHAHHRLLIVD